jgi:heme/copper-type cytochrome/quinol oxidase subunit 2
MKITIKDYNLQNIIFVHNFVLIFLIFVLLFVGSNNSSIKILLKNLKFILKKKKINLNFTHNMILELVWTIIPILIIIEIIFPSLSLIASEDIDHKGNLYTVGVIGNQWYWNYELNLALGVIKYVSNLVLLEEENNKHQYLSRLLATTKTVPIVVGIKTAFYITSNDVNHSWALPSLGIKVDAIPGRINLKTVIASRLGLYSGMCSELCGVEHGFMPISVQVLTFSKWWTLIKDSLENVNSKNMYKFKDLWYINK